MAILESHFETGSMLVWSWPLNIGVYDPEATLVAHLNQFQHIKNLSRTHSLSEEMNFVNIKIFPGGIRQVDFDNPEFRDSVGGNAGVIFILEPLLQIFGADVNITEEDQQLVDKIREYTNASGVFHLECPHDIGGWLDYLIIELSHNQSLPEALRRMNMQGYYYYDEKLLTETRLSHVVSGIIQGLKAFMSGRNLEMTSRFWNGTKKMTGSELAEMLENVSPHFGYHQESNEATDIAQITDVLYQSMDAPVFNIGNKNFFWAMAGPLEEFGGELEETVKEESISGEEEEDESTFPTQNVPRFLQVQIISDKDPKKVFLDYLEKVEKYNFKIRIGYPDAQWILGKVLFPTEAVFEKSENISEPILIKFIDKSSGKTYSDHILLSRNGNSTSVTFPFTTGQAGKTFEGHVYAYHQNRLIQEAVFVAPVFEPNHIPVLYDPLYLEIVFCARKKLDNPQDRMPFGTSLQIETNNGKESALHGVSENKPVEFDYTSSLSQLIEDVKNKIEEAVVDLDLHPEDIYDDNNVELLKFLAFKGNDIFVKVFKEDHTLKGPFQLVTNRDEFLPLDFVYTLPPPYEDASLCRDAKTALEEGSCKNCFDKTLDPAPHICPFGFWAFSEVVERQHNNKNGNASSYDFSLMIEPSGERTPLSLLNETLFAASNTVEKAKPGLLQQLAQSIQSATTTMSQATDWNEWTDQVKTNPDSLILVVHIERDDALGVEKMEIGDAQFLIKNHFGVNKLKANNSDHAPLVIIIGCEPNNITYHGFDIASTLLSKGAAIVISNFTKIRGRQAGPIVISLVESLKSLRGKEFRLGDVVLKLRQQLLAKGIMASLSLMVYGDADWKIKI